MQAVGVTLAFSIAHAAMTPIFVLVYGLSVAAPLMLLPLLLAESLGLRRFGLLAGLAGLAQTFGAMTGPLVAGAIFDSVKSYAPAFELFIAINLVGALAAFACKPYVPEVVSAAALSDAAPA